MANKITYTDKIQVNPKKTHVNQFWADDANEIKNKFNLNDDILDALSVAGAKTYQTYADLLAVSPVPDNGTPAKVANDVTSSNNGFYSVVGGAWVKDAGVDDAGVLQAEINTLKLDPKKYISVNHNNVIYTDNVYVKGFCVGNSIMQGSGATSINETIPWVLAAKLQTYFGTGSTSNWAPTNYGVGGATTGIVAQYISDLYTPTTDTYATGEVVRTKKQTYSILLTLRNDLTVFSSFPERTKTLLDIAITNCKINNIEPIVVIDPPKVNMTTGVNEDLTNDFLDFRKVAIVSANRNGATIVDAWSYFEELNQQGEDLRDYTDDGTHPNDAGYEIISELIFQALITQDKNAKAKSFFSDYELASVYEAYAGDVTTATDFTGLTTASTARKEETGETTTKAFQLTTGETIEFANDSPCKGVLVTVIGGATGSFNCTYAYVTISGSYANPTAAVREFTHYIPFSSGFFGYNKSGRIVLTATDDLKITGVTFINEKFSYKQEKLYGLTGSGTVTEGTLPNTKTSQILSNEGDYFDADIYGSIFTFWYEKGVNKGKFTYQIDGGATTEINCYVNAAPTQTKVYIDMGDTGWHTLRITVTAKDAASSAETIEVGDFKKYIKESDASIDYIDFDNNTQFDLRKDYNKAEIVETFSGTSKVYKSLSNELFAKEGTGEARIKFE